ncbi:variable surface protein Vir4, putative [Plasmodium vivax]|uniref:Variable surface protein Vir4, putative n=1 Tax=Plasmodium vivax (strain Salvador I) TaxID=126793 RepID=A5KDD1_PLAVS|nr:variable surface protein Vir4, putative [Plasmodium vivax]EDL42638.1 variable surface protein Vir4, putative [Plasmodium vivax]|eukprot:XP_001612431.1 variable surface protein Vir4 [Plasmodium vivax Sal-1]
MVEKDIFGKQFYNYLNNYEDLNEYYLYCTSLGRLSSKIKHSNLKILCEQLVKYLISTYIILNKEKLKYDPCILLNYWVYNRLVNIFGTDDISVINPSWSDLVLIWNDIVYKPSYEFKNNKCVPDDSIVTQNDWRKRKRLYEYCVNYDTIKKTIPNFGKACPEYWSYVKSHTSVFEYFEKYCSEKKYQCPKFYDECKQHDPKKVLETFDCHNQMMKKQPEDAAANARSTLQAGMPAGQEASSGMSTSSEVSAGGSPLTRDGTHPATKTGDILLGVVATSLTSGALYRFTPLGRIIRNGLGWNNNNMRNMHGSEYGLFDYAPESFNPYTGGGEEHYIGYQPA